MASTLKSMSTFVRTLGPSQIGLLAAIYIAYQLTYRLILWPKYLSPLRHLPTPPGSKPLIGHTLTILGDKNGKTLQSWVDRYGPTLRVIGPFSSEYLILAQAEHLEKVFGKDAAHDYPKPSFLRKALEIMFGYGLVTVVGDEHRSMRKAMNPAFSMANLSAQTPFHYEAVDGIAEIFNNQVLASADPSKGAVIQIYSWMSKATLDIICQAGFGYRADSLHNPHDALAEAYKSRTKSQSGANLTKLIYLMVIPGMLRLMRSSWLYRRRHWLDITRFTSYFRVLHESMHDITRISEKLFQEKVNESMNIPESEAKKDLMSILVRSRQVTLEKGPGVYSMNDAAMVDQVLTFLGAGHTATAITITAALWSLANDQKTQARLREEVTPLMEGNMHPDFGQLKGLPWLDCVVMETLRIFPAIPLDGCIANKTDYVGDILVPKGTVIYIPITIANTYKGVWGEDANEWKPERWFNLPEKYNPTYSFLSFLAGPHACIGKTMAMMELKFALARLITNFTFEPAYDGQVLQLSSGVSTVFLDGMPLLVKRV